jgi:bacillithiol biosynthesis cysteine-adding enzyme BshC
MASEDHDFEEVNHFYHFNKKYSWADNQTGAVGKFSTKGLENLINEIKDLPHFVISAYLESKTLSEATHKLVNELFGNYGLVVIDADNRNLKNNFSSHIQADIFEQKAFKTVAKQSKSLQKLGFETQVNAREINFFYLEANQRERIILEDNRYKILNTSISFSENELRKEIQNFPEKFSPNVIIRPLYQEHILPNLAYIGGPSELAYWLQFKTFFEESRVDFPILFPRNFGMIVNQSIFSKIQKFQLDYYTLIKGEDAIKEHYFSHFSKINNNIEPNISNIDLQISQIKAIALELDKTLDGFIESQKNDIHKTLDNISKKLKKVREQKEAEGLKQILNTRQKLFPDGNLQERRDNFLTFYLNNPLLIENLLQLFSPFDFKFHVLTEKANV